MIWPLWAPWRRKDAVFPEQPTQGLADPVEDDGLQLAVPAGDDAVAAPGIKPDAGFALLVQTHRELDFVPVAVHLGGGEDGLHLDVQAADPLESVCHRRLFGLQLGLVAQVAQAAPAAGACYRAVRRDAVGRGLVDLLHDAKGVPLAVFHHPGLDLVAGSGAGHKDRFAFPMADAAAVAGQPLDGEGDDLVFL